MNEDMTGGLAKHFTDIMEERQLTITWVAIQSETSIDTLSKFLSGSRLPKPSTVSQICRVLHVDFNSRFVQSCVAKGVYKAWRHKK